MNGIDLQLFLEAELDKEFPNHKFYDIEIDFDVLTLSWKFDSFDHPYEGIGTFWLLHAIYDITEKTDYPCRFGFPFPDEVSKDRALFDSNDAILIWGADFPQPWHDKGWSDLSERQKREIKVHWPYPKRLDLDSNRYEKGNECSCGTCRDCKRRVWKIQTELCNAMNKRERDQKSLPISKRFPHDSTIKCPHIKNSWEQKDGGIVNEGKGVIRQLCAVCYAQYKKELQES